MTTKPWRVVPVTQGSGRFTREQIEAAVLAVKERNESRRKQSRASGGGKSRGSDAGACASSGAG